MAHSYETTHARHRAYQGLRFTVSSLSLAAIIGFFTIHWIVGVISILPMMLLTGYIKSHLDARATYLYLTRDCGVSVTYAEAREYDDYFSPNDSGYWLPLDHLRKLPVEERRPAMLTAIAQFDERRKQSNDSPQQYSSEQPILTHATREQELNKKLKDLEKLAKDLEESKRLFETRLATKTKVRRPSENSNDGQS